MHRINAARVVFALTMSVVVTFTFWSAATGDTQLGGTYQDSFGTGDYSVAAALNIASSQVQ
ncbi:MAG: hypothetical protein ABFD69_11290 [Candidatus Sumerlaeia bacterium]